MLHFPFLFEFSDVNLYLWAGKPDLFFIEFTLDHFISQPQQYQFSQNYGELDYNLLHPAKPTRK